MPVASDKRGTKRQCLHCGMKYYDLNRDPILCPGCQKPYEDPAEIASRKAREKAEEAQAAAEAAQSVEVDIDPAIAEAGAEVVSFEDAEEGVGEVSADADKDIPDVEGIEDIGGEVDNVFVETDDDDDAEIEFGVTATKDEE